jgi:hypothetical protein
MLNVGDRVGARRWPFAGAHPDCWGRPWAGTLLAQDDPRAWAHTLRFPGREPSAAEASAWVAELHQDGLLSDRVPVLWDFGRIYWESIQALRPYVADVSAWEKERQGC